MMRTTRKPTIGRIAPTFLLSPRRKRLYESLACLGGASLLLVSPMASAAVDTVMLPHLAGTGTIDVGADALVVGSDNSDTQFNGSILMTGEGWDHAFGTFTKVGTGTLTIDGARIEGGETYVTGGSIAQTSGATTMDYLSVGTGATGTQPNVGSLAVSGGSLTFTTGLQVGDWGGTGTVTQTGGDVRIVAGCGDAAHCSSLNIGNQGGHGVYAISGGTLSIDSGFFDLGRNSGGHPASDGLLLLSGTGRVDVTNSSMIIGNWLAMGPGDVAGTGTVTQTGGVLSIDANSHLYLSGSGDGTYNLNGGVLQIGGHSLQGYYNYLGGSYALNLGGGTIQVNGAALVTDVGANLVAGTTSTLDTNGLGATWSGVLSGAGSLRKDGAGVLWLTGINTYTGNTTVSAGTLQIGNAHALGAGTITLGGGATLDVSAANDSILIASLAGSGAVNLGASSLVLTAADDTFSGTIGGSGGVELRQGHEVVAGAQTYTGDTTVTGGELEVTGSLDHSVVRLHGGTLSGGGSVAGVVAGMGSVISPLGAGTGEFTIKGNLSQEGGSTYIASLHGDTSNRLVVGGSATIADGASLTVEHTSGDVFARGARYEVLSAEGGIQGAYTLSGGELSAFYRLEQAYDKTHLYLDTVQVRDFVDAATTPNQVATARALDSVASTDRLRNTVGSLATDAGARTAFNALSGEIHADAKSVLIRGSSFDRDAMTDRLRDTLSKEDEGGVWERVSGIWGHTDANGNASRLDQSTRGVLIGADTAVADVWRIGVTGSYEQATFKSSALASNGTSDSYSVGVFGGAQWGRLGLSVGSSYSWHDIRTDRRIDFSGISSSLEANYRAKTGQVFGELGYSLQGGPVRFVPFANVAYVRLRTDGYGEKGGAGALTGSADTSQLALSTIGMHMAAAFAPGPFDMTAHASLGWRRAFGARVENSRQAFAGSQAFSVDAAPLAHDAAVADAGVTMQLMKNVAVDVSYTGQYGGNERYQGVRGNLTWSF